MNKQKRIIVSVTNDLATDQRVNKVCQFLVAQNLEVILVGRLLKNSLDFAPKNYTIKRFKLLFNKGVLFYVDYNFRLFLYLIFSRFDALLANDLDTLGASYFASLFKRKNIYYDSHELFTEVPELINNPVKRKVWLFLEKLIVPKLNYCYTVNQSIAAVFYEKYKVKFSVVKNFPIQLTINKLQRNNLNLPEDKAIVILQGAGININRGAEEMLMAMQYLENSVLLIIGSGDVLPQLKKMTSELKLNDRIIFKDKMPYAQMMQYTACADVGISLDKPIGLNYEFSLPNKLFDYVQAEVPVLASDLTEIKKVYAEFLIGELVSNFEPKYLADKLKLILEKAKNGVYKEPLQRAKQQLIWENQTDILKQIYSDLI